MAEDTSDDRLAHLGEDNLESAQMGTSHTGVSRGGEDVTDESELGLQRVDQLTEEGATVVDLAGDQQFWRFGHVIVDEAQELSPMQWRMIKRRTQGGSITIVGDVVVVVVVVVVVDVVVVVVVVVWMILFLLRVASCCLYGNVFVVNVCGHACFVCPCHAGEEGDGRGGTKVDNPGALTCDVSVFLFFVLPCGRFLTVLCSLYMYM